MSRLVYLAGSFVLAILGLFAVARATDVGMSLFGAGLTLVSLAFGLFLVKRGADSLWGHG
ncbi:hypothetical protein EJV46_13875 [Roseococcus sp. SYP-B2431]|uniref:hypothetical protein n=1 Tax=Roseococcus sp. SYP-B2431 TaxID=2496640 RepID=UPI0010E2CE2E|nr:hypothetical protein [Roseococcus sp. SYP-B2431]TCH98271.1 hypothetical protein EJV46_13875 [Roseococcus sp. SYP-B2431]